MRAVVFCFLFFALNLSAQLPRETLGPSSRRTPIAISEIMYKPAARTDPLNLEYLELYNSNPWSEDISHFRIDGLVQYIFPPNTKIPAQSFIVVAADPSAIQSAYGLSGVFGPYTNSLKANGLVQLYNEQDALLLEINFDDVSPWPMGAAGTGHSIVLARPSYGEADGRAWERSETLGGSPGKAETSSPSSLRAICINELVINKEADFVELYNHSTNVVSLAGCVLTDDVTSNKYVMTASMQISAGGYISLSSANLGFRHNPAGQTLYLRTVGGFVLDALKLGPLEQTVASGRYPDGSADWSRLSTPTFGKTNAQPLISPLGINEIMYHPISGLDDDQYIELFNQGPDAIDLTGWKFVAGVTFTFPSNTVVQPNGYLVVGRNVDRLKTNYAQLNAANCLGNFNGHLSSHGERVALAKPGFVVRTNTSGELTTNRVDIVVDEVTYGTGGRWGRWADGGGSSLELVDCTADKRIASNWADSDDTAKSEWTTVETTGTLDLGNNSPNSACNFAQIGLLDGGECLIDDVEIVPAAIGDNYVSNGNFENGATGWSFFGDHSRSTVDQGVGYPSGGRALHLRTADSIWPGGNSVQTTLTGSLTPNTVATLRFKGRWLHGCPEPLLRVNGNWLDVAGRLPIPANLGTPGLPNSQQKTSVGPLIHHVTHSPALPASGQSVAVTAQISNPGKMTTFRLNYRIDPSNTLYTVTMRDDGTSGDAVPHDGVFTGLIPGQSSKTLVAFTLQAVDTAGGVNFFPERVADNAPARECVIGFGDPNPSMDFGAYHVWLTKRNIDRLVALPVLSNEDIDGTLVYGNRVIYNMGLHYGGSPWHQSYDSPVGSRACHYIWSMPKDDLLLGASSFNKIHWPGNDIQNDSSTSNRDDPTIQREQTANLFLRALGLPWINRRYVAVYVNGGRRGSLMEDSLRPSGSVADEYFPGETGAQLYKVQPWYELSMNPNGNTFSFQNNSWCYLASYTSAGTWKPARYRWCWQLRQTPDSLNNLTNVYSLVTAALAVSTNADYLENVADMENWMRLMAANHAAGNWDCFGTSSGQNIYGWVSDQRRWTLFMFDFSICLGNNIAWQPGANLFTAIDPTWQRIYATPKYRRMYCRALKELVNGIMVSANVNPIVEAKYSAFVNNGFTKLTSPSGIESWISSARSSIASQLANEDSTALLLTTTGVQLSAVSNVVSLTGVAPLEATTFMVNGTVVTPVWTSAKAWKVNVPVPAGTSTCTLTAYDRFGNPVGSPLEVTVTNGSVPESPVGKVVFNEIMFNGPTDTQYVELYNSSANTTFDLSGWTINGLDYTFPLGSAIEPGRYLVIAKSRTVFANTYTPLIPVFGQFDGALQLDGETLTLIQPGTPDVVIDRVRYESATPWPNLATTAGTSLQLVDPIQDNSRVANWQTAQATPAARNSVASALSPFPTLWLNEAQPENLVGNVDNFGERDPWVELYNSGTSPVSLDNCYLSTNYASLTQWAFPSNTTIHPGQFLVIWCDGQSEQTSGSILHTSFRLNPGTGSVALSRLLADNSVQIVDYFNYTDLPPNQSYGDFPDGQPFYREAMFYASPSVSNNTVLPPVNVIINEWMAQNSGFIKDPLTTKSEDWFELYNPTDTPADLSSYYLTDNLGDPFQYQIPAGYRVPAHGFLLVWADGRTSTYDAAAPELHVLFNLSAGGEAIGLFSPLGIAVDTVTFNKQTANVSEGRFPDGGTLRLFMNTPSPSAPNILPPATNALAFTAIAMQADGQFELTFPTSPGHTYRVEYADDLTSPEWLSVAQDQFATDQVLTIRADATAAQRFYRLVLVK